MTKGNSVKQSLRWMIFGRAISQSTNWLVTIFVIRILTPADYGLLAMAMLLIAGAQMLRDMGLQHSLVQVKDLKELTIRQVFTLVVLLNIGIFLFLYLAAPYAAHNFNEPDLANVIRILAFQFPIIALQTVPSAMLSRAMDFRTKALVSAKGAMTNSAVTLVLALLGFGVWSLILGNIAASIVRVIALGLAQRMFYVPTLDFSGFRQLFSFGGFVMLSGFLHYVQMKSADLLVGKLLGTDALGVYSVSNRLATLPMQKMAAILSQIGFAAFSKIKDDMADLREKYLRMQSVIGFFAFPVFWGLAGVTESLIPVILGDQWVSAIIPMQLIALAAPLRMFFNTTTPALHGVGNSRLVFTNLLLSACTMPFAYYIAIDWGINGVAAVWVVYYPLLFTIYQSRFLSALGVPYLSWVKIVVRPLLISLAMLLLLLYIDLHLLQAGISPVYRLVPEVIFGITFYSIISYWFNRKALMTSWKLIF